MRWLGVLWLAAGLGGTVLLIDHALRPGKVAAAQLGWPGASTLERREGRASLVVILHPFCPCGRATLTELGQVLAQTGDGADATVIFAAPEDLELDFRSAPAVVQAAEIPGVTVLLDRGGREAARFGAFTSGETLLFAPSGELLFHGGITPSRGHLGDSPGRRALVTLLAHGQPEQRSAPVFGCALLGEKL